jgi:hypothetical protein
MAITAKTNNTGSNANSNINSEMGTPVETFIHALKGGVVRLDSLISRTQDRSATRKETVDEIKGLKDLLGAVARGLESLEIREVKEDE